MFILRSTVKALLLIVIAGSCLAADKVSRLGEYSGYAPELYSSWIRSSVYVPMRDGVKLAVDIFRPAENGHAVDKRYPVIWEAGTARGVTQRDGRQTFRLENKISGGAAIAELTKYGYVVVEVDRRGLGASYGSMKGYHNRAEANDAYDITEWLAAQPWSDENIGMFGCSNTGEAVMHALGTASPHLKAVVAGCYSWNKYDGFLRGGILANWGTGPEHPYTDDLTTVRVDGDQEGTLLLEAAKQHQGNTSLYQLWKSMPFRDSWTNLLASRYWMESSASTYRVAMEKSDIPVYSYGGWFDDFRKEAFVAYANLHNPGKVLIGPWEHCQNDGFAMVTERQRFFDHYLKGIDNSIEKEPPIAYFTIGAEKGKEWRQTRQWPLPNQRTTQLYLEAAGSLGNSAPKPASAKDSAPANYGVSCPQRTNPLTQTCVLDRWATLFTGTPLSADTEVTGHPIMHLWAAANVSDINFFAYLEDVAPDGTITIATDGRLKASLRRLGTAPYSYLGLPYHRSFAEDAVPLTPGEPVDLVFDMLPLSRIFPKGHRIRVAITTADPREKDRQEPSPAPVVTLYREKDHASFVALPVIPQ
jgi:putative CocE/NonD family hydrolase